MHFSKFCLGTINWGTKTVGDDLDRLYDAFRERGGSFFDSAHVYACWLPNGLGASEHALGEIIRRRGDRDNVVLATKGGHPHMDGGYPRPDRYLAAEVIARDIDESLERLCVDEIDLYFLHRDDPRVPVSEIIDTLNEHVANGRLRQLGASNWKTARIAAANEYAGANGKQGFVANQPKLSLAVPKPSKDPTVPPFDEADLAWHTSSQFMLCAYSPTANGFFATNGEKAKGLMSEDNARRLARVNLLAQELGATPSQIALAWLLHHPFPLIPILGTTNVVHLIDALGAARVRLSQEQFDALTREDHVAH